MYTPLEGALLKAALRGGQKVLVAFKEGLRAGQYKSVNSVPGGGPKVELKK